MTSMEREIAQTAGLLRARAEGWLRACDAARERAGDCTWAVVGRGSSGHAGTYFSYAMMLAAGRAPVDLRPWAVHAAT